MQFAGDGALYVSSAVGSKVADALKKQAIAGLQGYSAKEDRLHIVTHSMGTVILFDILFSSRWDDDATIGHDSVMTIRSVIYGIDPHPEQGIRLGSITTMGSPIGIFSLMDVAPPSVDTKSDPSKAASTHDITPSLARLLAYLHQHLTLLAACRAGHPHPADRAGRPDAAAAAGSARLSDER